MSALDRYARRLVALLLCGALAGCYAHRAIPLTALEPLTAAPGKPPSARITGLDCDDCAISVDRTTPLILRTRQGRRHRLTPFDFHMSDAQLVSPDYGVLIDRADLIHADVRQLSVGRTVAMIALVAGVAVGSFVLIRSQAGADTH